MSFIKNNSTILMHGLSVLFALLTAFKGHQYSEEFQKENEAWVSHTKPLIEFIPIMLFILACLWVVVSIIQSRQVGDIKKTNERLKDEQDKFRAVTENVKDLFNGYLYQLSSLLEFGNERENNERVTLYVHDGDSHFVPFSRYSSNPKFRSVTRDKYPDDEGVISEGWEHDWAFENRIPCRETEKGKWLDFHASKKMSRNTARKLNMASSLYAVKRISDDLGNSVAVLVVESTARERYEEEFLKTHMSAQEKYVCELIIKLRQYIPTPDVASEKGL